LLSYVAKRNNDEVLPKVAYNTNFPAAPFRNIMGHMLAAGDKAYCKKKLSFASDQKFKKSDFNKP